MCRIHFTVTVLKKIIGLKVMKITMCREEGFLATTKVIKDELDETKLNLPDITECAITKVYNGSKHILSIQQKMARTKFSPVAN